MALTPSATPKATPERLAKCAKAGVRMMALSLDGSCAERHDKIRMVEATFDRTILLAKAIGDLGLPLQINTTIIKDNINEFEQIAEHVVSLKAKV